MPFDWPLESHGLMAWNCKTHPSSPKRIFILYDRNNLSGPATGPLSDPPKSHRLVCLLVRGLGLLSRLAHRVLRLLVRALHTLLRTRSRLHQPPLTVLSSSGRNQTSGACGTHTRSSAGNAASAISR